MTYRANIGIREFECRSGSVAVSFHTMLYYSNVTIEDCNSVENSRLKPTPHTYRSPALKGFNWRAANASTLS